MVAGTGHLPEGLYFCESFGNSEHFSDNHRHLAHQQDTTIYRQNTPSIQTGRLLNGLGQLRDRSFRFIRVHSHTRVRARHERVNGRHYK